MGNNQAFSDFESVVIATYDKGVLDRELLSKFMEIHRGSDIDRGGMAGTLSKDGMDVEEIVLKVFAKKMPERPKLPKDHKKWTPEHEALNEAYWDSRYEAFHEIADKKFGWR